MSRIHRSLAILLALTTCTAGALTACGSDDGSADETTTTTAAAGDTTDSSTDGSDPADAELASFCDPYVDVTVMLSGEPDPDALTAAVDEVEANVPDSIGDSVDVMVAAVRSVLDSGGQDFSAFETPEFADAQAEVDPFVFENCEFDSTVEVSGIDFGFEGLPETIDQGRVAILFTNDGTEAHEIAVMRRNDGVTESFEELLALPEEEAMEKVTPVGGAFAAENGAQGLLVGDFEPGDYIAICFIPAGSVSSDGAITEGTGAPHFTHGMQQEFTVS